MSENRIFWLLAVGLSFGAGIAVGVVGATTTLPKCVQMPGVSMTPAAPDALEPKETIAVTVVHE